MPIRRLILACLLSGCTLLLAGCDVPLVPLI